MGTKIRLRKCRKCKRRTLQARANREYPEYNDMWYCPCCGTTWEEVTRTADEEHKEVT